MVGRATAGEVIQRKLGKSGDNAKRKQKRDG